MEIASGEATDPLLAKKRTELSRLWQKRSARKRRGWRIIDAVLVDDVFFLHLKKKEQHLLLTEADILRQREAEIKDRKEFYLKLRRRAYSLVRENFQVVLHQAIQHNALAA